MKIQRFIIQIILLLGVLSGSAGAQFDFNKTKSSMLSQFARKSQELKSNLQYVTNVYDCSFSDTTFRDSVANILGGKIIERMPEYAQSKKLKWTIKNCYIIKEFRNLVFINVPNPVYLGYSFKFIYDRNQDKFYFPGDLSIEEINTYFVDYKPILTDDREALLGCWFISILKHPNSYVRFIGDIKELLLEAVTGTSYRYYDLESIKPFLNIKIELPVIYRDNDNTVVSYYFAEHDNVMKATVKFKGETIIDYSEKEIAEVPLWYGFNRLW